MQKERITTVVNIAEVIERDCYSIMLLAASVSRRDWLAEEYLNGRISEKQFLETLLIQNPAERKIARNT